MNISLKFKSDDVVNPVLTIDFDADHYRIRNIRWIQFIALLTHRRLNQSSNCYVYLEELQDLNSFHGSGLQNIGKYISNSSARLPAPLAIKLKNQLNLNTTGPYALFINPSRIQTDFDKLNRYLNRITIPSSRHIADLEALWELGIDTHGRCDFRSSSRVMDIYINSLKEKGSDFYQNLAIAHIYKWQNDRWLEETSNNCAPHLRAAKSISMQIKDQKARITVLSYVLAMEGLAVVQQKSNINYIMSLIKQSLALAKELPKNDSNKICLIAGRFHHLGMLMYLEAEKEDSCEWIEKATDLYLQLSDKGKPDKVFCLDDIASGTKLHADMLRSYCNGRLVSSENIAYFSEILNSDTCSPMVALHMGGWIRNLLLKCNRKVEAFDHTQKMLIKLANLHDTKTYRRLAVKNDNLWRKLT